MEEKKRLVEACLFVAARPMNIGGIAEATGLSVDAVKDTLDDMKGDYEDHGIGIRESNGLYELRVKEEHEDKVGHLAPNKDFSRAALQTLAVIAFKHPVKQSVVVEVRGNRVYEHLKELEDRGFIKRTPKGHTSIISLTNKFLEYFGVKTIEGVKEKFKDTALEAKIALEEKKREPKKKKYEKPEEEIVVEKKAPDETAEETPKEEEERLDEDAGEEDEEKYFDEGEQEAHDTPEKQKRFKSQFADVVEE